MPATRLRAPETIEQIIAMFSVSKNLDLTAKAFGASVSGIRAVLRIYKPDLLNEPSSDALRGGQNAATPASVEVLTAIAAKRKSRLDLVTKVKAGIPTKQAAKKKKTVGLQKVKANRVVKKVGGLESLDPKTATRVRKAQAAVITKN